MPQLHLKLKTHMLLWGNLLVLVTAAAVGSAVVHLATAGVEKRLTADAADNAAKLIRELRLPLSPRLMQNLQRVNGCEFAAWLTVDKRLLASTLSPTDEASLGQALAANPTARRISLPAGRMVLAHAAINRGESELVLLARQDMLSQATRQVVSSILGLTLLAAACASLLAWWLAERLTRPVRALAARLEHLAAATQSDLQPGSVEPDDIGDGDPVEIRQLAEAFNSLRQQLLGARERLAAAARLAAVGQLSASVAHELRNPLSGIKMNARLLQEELTAVKHADPSLDIILREIERMELYLQELLNVARHGHVGGHSITPEAAATSPTADLPAITQGLAALLSGRIRHAKVNLILDLPPQLPSLRMPPESLRQVLLNFMLNALDAMPQGGTLTVRALSAAASRVRCEVRDTGSGVQVPPGTDIFAPFTSTKPHGAGLGLHISQRLVEACGGAIGYTATPPGTTFWMELGT